MESGDCSRRPSSGCFEKQGRFAGSSTFVLLSPPSVWGGGILESMSATWFNRPFLYFGVMSNSERASRQRISLPLGSLTVISQDRA